MSEKQNWAWMIPVVEDCRGLSETIFEHLDFALKAVGDQNYAEAREEFEEAYNKCADLCAWMEDIKDDFMNQVK